MCSVNVFSYRRQNNVALHETKIRLDIQRKTETGSDFVYVKLQLDIFVDLTLLEIFFNVLKKDHI
jgi:hypothetical protein